MDKEPRQGISAEEMLHYQDLARQYSKKSLLPLFGGDFPDGNLKLLPEKLETAFSTGIAASPELSMSGSTYGIWGSAIDEQGMTPSLLLLSVIAETCGGVAMCLHAQGMASNLILQAKSKKLHAPVRVGLCLQEGIGPPFLGTIVSPGKDAPARIMTTATAEGQNYIINGAKSFVYSMDGIDAYVVLARVGDNWGCFLAPANDSRITKTDVGVRSGLRACRVEHVEFKNVLVPREARIDDGDARGLVIRALCLNWAGMSAIAVGIAKGAAIAARKYAADRYQGGTQIEEHPAIKMLIAGSEASILAAESAVFALKDSDFTTTRRLLRPAATKLAVLDLCARAVTDCLQSFGGYGYMEDFGMEKRLRDVTVIKSASGSPTYLKQLVFDVEKENAR